MVKSIVVFPLEFQGLAFRHGENLAKRQIEVYKARTAQGIVPCVAVSSDSLWGRIGGWVEPQICVGISDARITDLIGAHIVKVRKR